MGEKIRFPMLDNMANRHSYAYCGSLRDQNFDIQVLSAEQTQKATPNKERHFVIEDKGSGVSKLTQRKQGISENPVL